MPAPRFCAGFTFWQMAVVFVLILATAAILFPVFQPVRENNTHGNCQSNMKQLGLAYVQYSQDSDEMLPSGQTGAGTGWAGQLYPFVKATGIYKCPKDIQTGNYVSYAENRNVVRQSLASFNNPAATVELYETTTLDCDPSAVFPRNASPPAVTHSTEYVSATGLSASQNDPRHDPATFALNFLAEDGHVRWLLPGVVSAGPAAVPTAKITKQGPLVVTFSVN